MTGNEGNGFAKITLLTTPDTIKLSLNGQSQIIIPKGSNYQDAGATLTKNGTDISNQLQITGSVDINTVGEYTITYSYFDSSTQKNYTVSRKITVIEPVSNYNYTGSVQTFIAPYTGEYKLEVWGAQGGMGGTSSDLQNLPGGTGGYSTGTVTLQKDDVVYVYVGGQGNSATFKTTVPGGFNGGGTGSPYNGNSANYYYHGSGGGASDIRIGTDSLYSRTIVAGGGGGSGGAGSSEWAMPGAFGGGEYGGKSTDASSGSSIRTSGSGGTQTSGGIAGYYQISNTGAGTNGSFGIGGNSGQYASNVFLSGGGGGGWYGGGRWWCWRSCWWRRIWMGFH